jgi:hypothetical protein
VPSSGGGEEVLGAGEGVLGAGDDVLGGIAGVVGAGDGLGLGGEVVPPLVSAGPPPGVAPQSSTLNVYSELLALISSLNVLSPWVMFSSKGPGSVKVIRSTGMFVATSCGKICKDE